MVVGDRSFPFYLFISNTYYNTLFTSHITFYTHYILYNSLPPGVLGGGVGVEQTRQLGCCGRNVQT